MSRPFDKATDVFYHPDNTTDLYLTPEQISEGFENLKKTKDEEVEATKAIIQSIETYHRLSSIGELSKKEAKIRCDNTLKLYLEKYGYWPMATKTYESFYAHFIRLRKK